MTDKTPTASIVIPAYNAAETIADTLTSIFAQDFTDYEIIVVDDGSTDNTLAVLKQFDDPRLRIVQQKNRGLAGAHNTGIHESRGPFVAFCDADDLWVPEKLGRHIEHLQDNPQIGISFAGSRLIDEEGTLVGIDQSPKLTAITCADIFKRNPIGNGSAAVMRREALDEFAYRPFHETERDWWFDENFRQSDDIEGWLRFATTMDWTIEGIPGHLTLYRVNTRGLSANIEKQFETWMQMRTKIAEIVPTIAERHAAAAAAYQLRYLARRAVSMGDGKAALSLTVKALRTSSRPLIEEPAKTLVTLAASLVLRMTGPTIYRFAESAVLKRSS